MAYIYKYGLAVAYAQKTFNNTSAHNNHNHLNKNNILKSFVILKKWNLTIDFPVDWTPTGRLLLPDDTAEMGTALDHHPVQPLSAMNPKVSS